MKLTIVRSSGPKRFVAMLETAKGRVRTIGFGQKGGRTYIDHGDEALRAAYIARHAPRENWDAVNAGSLSRFVLWGDSTNMASNIAAYKQRFGLS